ncbi:putative ABC transport system permease protein [Evansella caseinilytica]|uniref:Putative ABC transport system permease protein n=1 Tax=Evansella caseinilytica TaxID=1503961 RepID=A0A1H3SWN2_9BACI|nr:ABC transporter permease [Evansella caseinilytica]SDZ42416.1 putative ABC transport system permease protein [Evansella caseinilytica]
MLPNTYHLLVGIDPEEEEKLTGIAFDDISEASPSGGWGQTFAGEGVVEKVIPVMELRDWQVPLQTRIQVEELNIDPEQTAGYRQRLGLTDNEEEWPFYFIHQFDNEEYEKIFVELMNYPAEKTDVVNADLGPYLTPFMVDYESLVISQDGEVDFMVADGTNIGLVSLNSTPVFYRVSAVEYEIHGERLQVKQTGEDQGVPLYRQVEKQGKDVAESIEQEEMIPFILDPVGTFTIGEYEESLAASPLGFYQLAPVYYLGTEKEEKLEMTATVKPGSFVTAPAQGVTNIASAAAIKENPIDAIRVRVADIDGYTSEAAAKITQIAEEIEAMGLHVTVIAGASPQKMEVEVEGLGLVEEAWTTLGAAGTIISLWNSNNVLLSLSFLFVSIVYLIHRQRSWYLQAQKEMNIMYQLGWRAKEAVRIAVSEQLIMFLAAAVVSALILLIIKSVFQLSYIIFVWMLFLVLVTMVLSVLLISKQVRRCFHRQVDEKKLVKKRHPLSPRSYTVKNIHYFRKLIVHSFMQIVVISATAPLVYLSVGVTQEQAGITLLGQYINAQISELHIVLIIGAYILTMVTLTENIFSMLKTRKKEIGTFRSLGWKFRHIFHLYAAETALWTGAAICIGHGLCFIVYSLFFPITAKAVVLLLASSSGLFAMMFLCSSLVIYYYLRKNIEKITAYTSL